MSYYLLGYNPGTPQYTFPRRGGAKLSGTVIMHTAECLADNIGEDTSAEGCASMIANRADWGSYHCLCDSDSIIRMAPWEYEVWGDTETNNWAVHISAALRTSDWLTMPVDRRERVYRNLAQCAAEFVAYMATKGVTVPLRRITGAEARARVPGFCAHGDSGIARSDPGAAFDWALFFRYTQEALNNGGISPQGSTTSEEDDMALFASIEDFKAAVVEAVEEQHQVTRRDTATNVLNKAVPYKDPITGKDTGETTTLATMVGFADFQAVQTRLAAATPQQIADLVPEEFVDQVSKLLIERLAA